MTLVGVLALPAMLKARSDPSFAGGIIGAGGTLGILILSVVGSILFGLATPTEAVSIGALGGMVLAVACRTMSFHRLRESAYLTVRTMAMVCWLFVGSDTFWSVFSYLGGEHLISEFVKGFDLIPLQFLIMAQAWARALDAIVMGKTVSTEMALLHPGKTRNPHIPAHTPGGSSSRSAATPAPAGQESTGPAIFNGLWTLCGTPVVTVPLLEADNGLPMGVPLVGLLGVLVWSVPRWDLGGVVAITVGLAMWDFFSRGGKHTGRR